MDVAYSLVDRLCNIHFGDLPSAVVEKAKLLILDTIGVAISGSSAPGCREVVGQVMDWGGKGESTIFVYGRKVPVFLAAFVNSMMARHMPETSTKHTIRP